MCNKNFIPEISVSQVLDRDLETCIDNAVKYSIHHLVRINNNCGAYCPKMMFYITGIVPGREYAIRAIIDRIRPLLTGYTIRLTKRAGFDAMLTVTITRKIQRKPTYQMIAG